MWTSSTTHESPPANSLFFAQVGCTADEEFLHHKMSHALVCSCIGLLMCMYFRFTITHVQSSIKIDDKLLDYDLVSIEDYSVTGKISRRFYDRVVEMTKPPEEPRRSDLSKAADSVEKKRSQIPIQRFKQYLVKEIERNL